MKETQRAKYWPQLHWPINCHWWSKYKLKPGKMKARSGRGLYFHPPCLILPRSQGILLTQQRQWLEVCLGTKRKHHRHLALSLPAVSDDAQRSNDGLGSVQDALTAPLHPALPVPKPRDEEPRGAHPARDRAASCVKPGAKRKRKTRASPVPCTESFLGEGRGQGREEHLMQRGQSPHSSAATAPAFAAYWHAPGDSESLLVARVQISHNPAESKKCPFLDWTFPSQPWQSDCVTQHEQCLCHWGAADVMAWKESCCSTVSKQFVSWSQLLQYIRCWTKKLFWDKCVLEVFCKVLQNIMH